MAGLSSLARGSNEVLVGYLYTNKSTNSPNLMGLHAGIGGVIICLAALPFVKEKPKLFTQYLAEGEMWGVLVVIAILGLCHAFFYNISVKLIGGILESFVVSFDVILAYLIQVLFFHNPLNMLSVVGSFCIVSAIMLMAVETVLIGKLPEGLNKKIL